MPDIDRETRDVIDRFAVMIRRIIQTHLYPADAIEPEDIEQEIRIKIWSFLKKGKKFDNLASYIKRVAFSTTIDELRKLKRMKPAAGWEMFNPDSSVLEARAGSAETDDPGVICEGRAMRVLMRRAVGELSENRRRVLLLYLEGMSVDEISDRIRWDKTKVRHLLYRGIDEIRTKIQPLQRPSTALNGRKDGLP
jgi:RNA polymerase sigma factor (sigma-70 family)